MIENKLTPEMFEAAMESIRDEGKFSNKKPEYIILWNSEKHRMECYTLRKRPKWKRYKRKKKNV